MLQIGLFSSKIRLHVRVKFQIKTLRKIILSNEVKLGMDHFKFSQLTLDLHFVSFICLFQAPCPHIILYILASMLNIGRSFTLTLLS